VGSRNNIIIAERDIFDYSNGEPPERYLTVLRALNVRSFPFTASSLGIRSDSQPIDLRRIRQTYPHQPELDRAYVTRSYASRARG